MWFTEQKEWGSEQHTPKKPHKVIHYQKVSHWSKQSLNLISTIFLFGPSFPPPPGFSPWCFSVWVTAFLVEWISPRLIWTCSQLWRSNSLGVCFSWFDKLVPDIIFLPQAGFETGSKQCHISVERYYTAT